MVNVDQGEDFYDKKDYDIAFDYLIKAAKVGNKKAKSVLASAGQDF